MNFTSSSAFQSLPGFSALSTISLSWLPRQVQDIDGLALTASLLLVAGTLLIGRIYSVRKVRFERLRTLQEKYPQYFGEDKEAMKSMTYKEAEEIARLASMWDMPWTSTLATTFALFKTYAIPTISSVLLKSRQLSDPTIATRRAEDTGVLILEFDLDGLDSDRSNTAIARVNWLHGRYGSLISNGDLLYTMSLFVYEPAVFAERFEWRALTQVEQEAKYIVWREIGARMGIKNIPATRQGLWDWKEAYFAKAAVYKECNAEVAEATFGILSAAFPAWMAPLNKIASTTFLDDKTREAFGLPKPPALVQWLIPALASLKGLVCGYLLYPRTVMPAYADYTRVDTSASSRESSTSASKSDLGPQVTRRGFLFEPWYVPADGSHMGVVGTATPGDKKWRPEGFTTAQLGPEALRNQGVEKTLQGAKYIKEQAAVCPFFQAQLEALKA